MALSMLAQQLHLLDSLIQILNKCTSQLHLVGEAPNAVAISHRHHHGFSYFSGTTHEVAVLQMLYFIILFMPQNGQSISCSISHASLERPPRLGGLDHLADAANMIGRRHLVDDHTHMPQV
jgi:hypothetical protein